MRWASIRRPGPCRTGRNWKRQVYRAEQPADASVNPDAAPVAMAAITKQMKSHQLPELQNGQIFQLNSGEMYQLNNGKLLALRDGMTFQLKNDQMLQLQHGQFYLYEGQPAGRPAAGPDVSAEHRRDAADE